jgi:hypothetical protein
MSMNTKLYEEHKTDFHAWLQHNVALIKQERYSELDMEHIREELSFFTSPLCGRGRGFAAGEGYSFVIPAEAGTHCSAKSTIPHACLLFQPFVLYFLWVPAFAGMTLVNNSPHPPFQGDLSHKGRGVRKVLLH